MVPQTRVAVLGPCVCVSVHSYSGTACKQLVMAESLSGVADSPDPPVVDSSLGQPEKVDEVPEEDDDVHEVVRWRKGEGGRERERENDIT